MRQRGFEMAAVSLAVDGRGGGEVVWQACNYYCKITPSTNRPMDEQL